MNSSMQSRGGFRDRIESKIENDNKNRAQINLAEFERQLQATKKKYKFYSSRLDYMKMVCQSVGHVNNENSPVITDTKNPVNVSRCNKDKCANYFRKNEDASKKKIGIEKTSRKSVSVMSLISGQSSSSSDLSNTNVVMVPKKILIVPPPTIKNIKKSELILKITNARTSTTNGNKMRKVNNKPVKISATGVNSLGNTRLEQSKILLKNNIGPARTIKFRKRKTRMRKTNSHKQNLKNTMEIMRPAITIKKSQSAEKNYYQESPLKENSESELKNMATTHFSEEEEKKDESWNEVVELYHNAAAKNMSPSVVSSKQQFKFEELKSIELENKPMSFTKFDNEELKQNSIQTQNNVDKQVDGHSQAEMVENSNKLSDEANMHRKDGLGSNTLDVEIRHSDCQQPSAMRSWCCESFTMRNYQQPTISSKLKRANRRCCVTTRVNLKHIPFIVGTSVTRSHNLKLNLQQVFSLMKHRQLTTSSDIRSMFIHKVGEGIDPVILFPEQSINNHENENRAITPNQILQTDIQQTRYVDQSKPQINHGDSAKISGHITSSSMLKRKEEELNMGRNDLKKYQTVTNNFSKIRNFMQRLHDQFEAMNDKYDKLQVEIQESKNPNLQKELDKLENEMKVKEEEISVIVQLYNEIMLLKHQMKMFREKNSVICITTHSNGKHSTRVSPSISARRSRNPFHLQLFDSQKLKTANNTRAPASSTSYLRFLLQSCQQQLSAP